MESKITIAKQILNDKYENIMLPMDNGLVKFNLDEIIYFEADSNYSMVHFTNRTKSLISRSLQIIESALLNTQFCRVQSKYLINLRHIKSYHKGKNPYIVLKNDVMIPISLNKREEFLGKLDLIAKKQIKIFTLKNYHITS